LLLLERALKLVAPHTCLICSSEGSLVCTECLPAVVVNKQPVCWRCNRLSDAGKTCRSCRASTKLAGVTVASHYEGAMKQLVEALKFERAREAAGVLAQLMTPLLEREQFDFITHVPTANRRRRERGFDHAELIAKQLARRLRLPHRRILARVGSGRQVGSGRRQRFAQMGQAFYGLRRVSGRILVVDDVLTTGATLSQAAAVIKQKGARQVWGAVVAKR
jgi:ComF family protein